MDFKAVRIQTNKTEEAWDGYAHTVNSHPFCGYEAGTLFLKLYCHRKDNKKILVLYPDHDEDGYDEEIETRDFNKLLELGKVLDGPEELMEQLAAE